ncbi:branched-chain amino acid ABC transporter permease [Aromatoleum petrolei]|uniref:Branched-chain amino acid ABC transporter permease n=1 Tax=Aromatoleum petrolei TaxID=76116 RepID=A0ABX1MXN2_9RHOO|nr:branched-chain amino acid ABC transporter permease [Aromatoleum petrolei]NMF91318.1 branched-chain amino acid ABC transporter permease [Aromatoleum petrolei]QTQ34417.1 putative phenylacetate ABC transport system permease protein 2 [Aromatoleum petrolei]
MKPTTRGFLFLAFVLAVLPLALPNAYYYDLAIRMAINATIAVGLNLLVGYTGQISLGHAGFFGIGAYASAILTSRYGLPSALAMGLGAAATAALAFVVARPILKLKGNYLAMATLGLGIILSMVIVNETEFTGGPDGMPVDAFSLFGLQIAGEQAWYGVVAVLLLFVTRGALNLIDAPAGRALQAIHGSEVAARVAGIDVPSFKVRVFVLSAVIASVMGSVTAHYVGFLTPGVAGFFHSIELITMVVLGGMASVFGSILGAVVLTLLPQLLSAFEGWETVIFGLILMLTMIFLPRGIVPTLRLKFAGRAA